MYLTLKFSQHAQHLIAARQLQHYVIISGYPNPPKSDLNTQVTWRFLWFIRVIAPFVILGSCLYGMGGGLHKSATGIQNNSEGIAYFFVLVGIVLFIYSFIAPRLRLKSVVEQDYTVARFYREPTIRFWNPNPVAAKGMDEEIRQSIITFRAFLEESKEIPATDQFEL